MHATRSHESGVLRKGSLLQQLLETIGRSGNQVVARCESLLRKSDPHFDPDPTPWGGGSANENPPTPGGGIAGGPRAEQILKPRRISGADYQPSPVRAD